ncbi:MULTISPECIES: bifunctional adenosylcobinamide kinase/adenosylcobinamide-phosphate guanylyltransferase [Methylomonas]|uniref:Bifunctional adenosylcobalamin biosynthesis protein n=2 Tax=Methylomonas TaxID=416 RepID=A0A126T3L4_9GAMM|nr:MULTISPECIES: bifunctional adenosylcobinamide kinase/adenosylcobinamide-phosphate guanylyltransferase [Methylomonas]AMK76668.1 bifunctional adenosylcobinamide kinase/adenosylcobinamide-phosphate guanylyltransferase [Methylomonas denitrificans]OAH97249.1 adenosylcobinamide kinase/adenosylcobinamide phosphate guanyltransferase [Methylomonas methanica]TCV82841.1 adenosylcobinamide kinase /adenosylcobinamide-phosphate guanylyltransferase [Methylomonas methanica]
MIELVLGGARSGKSRYAEQQALASGLPVVYIATAEAGDEEMHSRIRHHQQRRPQHWLTVEEPVALADVIGEYAGKQHCLLVDCLTLWLCNALFDKQGNLQEQRYRQHVDALCAVLAAGRQRVIMVSNEVGLGVVAADAMTRRFVDEAGFLHQKLAQLSNKVVLVTAGLPQILKNV